jgi:hypothetical protein
MEKQIKSNRLTSANVGFELLSKYFYFLPGFFVVFYRPLRIFRVRFRTVCLFSEKQVMSMTISRNMGNLLPSLSSKLVPKNRSLQNLYSLKEVLGT